jgi:RNA polymerase sigma-70 factor (ECF subfamily)
MDKELIAAARDGQEYAGAFLVSLHGPGLAAYCRSIAPELSDTDREHIICNAIERAVRRIETFDESRGSFKTWLRPFVLHATQDWRRDHAQLVELDPDRDSSTESNGLDNSEDGRLQPVIEALRDLLPTLRPTDQVIIALRDLENRSVENCADLLGITPDACRQRHHRARQRLKRLLADDPRVTLLMGDDQ